MTKETSAEVAAIGADLMNITGREITNMTLEGHIELAEKIRKVSASAVVQREPDPGQVIFVKEGEDGHLVICAQDAEGARQARVIS